MKMHPLEEAYQGGHWSHLGWLLWDIFLTADEESIDRMLAGFILEALTPRELRMVENIL